MELNGLKTDSGARNRSQSDSADLDLIFSNESISSALSAVSGAGSNSSVNSQDTVLKNGVPLKPSLDDKQAKRDPSKNFPFPTKNDTDAEKSNPVTVLSPVGRKKAFLVEKVDEEKLRQEQDELDSPVKLSQPPFSKPGRRDGAPGKKPVFFLCDDDDAGEETPRDDEQSSPVKELPLAALFRPLDKSEGGKEKLVDGTDDGNKKRKPLFSLPATDSEEQQNNKDSVSKYKRRQSDPEGNASPASGPRRKNSWARKISISSGKNQSPSRNRKISGTRKNSLEGQNSPRPRHRNSIDLIKPQNQSTPNDLVEAEEGQKDQLLELPKIKYKKKSHSPNRRVSYNDTVVSIPTDDENDEVLDEMGSGEEHDVDDEEDKLFVPMLKKRRPLFRPHDRSIKVLLIILFLTMVGGVTCIWIFYKKQLYEVEIGKRITFNEDTRTLIVRDFGTEDIALKGVFGLNIPNFLPYLCSDESHQTELCLRWPGQAVLNIKYWDATDSIGCYNISWRMLSDNFIPKDCFKLLDNANWYGGGLIREQLWPLEKQQHEEMPYVTGNILDGEYGSVIQAYWLSSRGVGIVVPTDVPLWTSINASASGDASGLCLSATYNGPYRQLSETVGSNMAYRMCKGPDFRKVHEFMISDVVETSNKIPDDNFLSHPGWSTWGKYGKNITQDKVLALYQEIKQHNFPAGHLEIFDKWEPNYGDLIFDVKNFPNPRKLVSELAKGGMEVMVCVRPFVDSRSEMFQEGVREGYFVMNEDDRVPGLTYWWNSVGAVVDFTSSKSSDWFRSRLQSLKNQTGIGSFRFDAGEINWLPHKPHFSKPQINPVVYSRKYVEFAESFGAHTIVTSSFHNQDIPVIIRIHDKSPTWDYANGLKSIIPTVLTLNLLGYPYLQLQVGGGGDNLHGVQNVSFVDSFPTRELYLRMLQIAIFLPSFQFSVLPWQYDQEMTNFAKQYVKFHEEFIVPNIQTLFSNYTSKGLPIIRPLWWIENTEAARTTDSEFLIGNSILVAPILEMGMSKRDIYLPKGEWRDPYKDMVIEGGIWLRHYSVPSNVVPYFVHV